MAEVSIDFCMVYYGGRSLFNHGNSVHKLIIFLCKVRPVISLDMKYNEYKKNKKHVSSKLNLDNYWRVRYNGKFNPLNFGGGCNLNEKNANIGHFFQIIKNI